jgi:hypothetical protein
VISRAIPKSEMKYRSVQISGLHKGSLRKDFKNVKKHFFFSKLRNF